ncbi:ATP-binding protein [Bacillus zhangzhouensis]|uniref:ATP-binding protein n=1 Tax=Bacillus zhangzhouensis TaxID=1178540 RepID=UPI002812BF24|nr:ATP-binding protein [Bacillus zhangzhouensis]MDR0127104.1 ATP-binding protein [Bacillus zhangzhouensis]
MNLETLNYKISSRATILLGRESVSKVDGAVIELVKNTYDADALMCFICFDIKNDCIYILDNGTGMTRETIENYWMLIGTDNKRSEYQSKRNRIKSGEKGIGRFALDRLGSKCEMYTKNKASQGLIYWETDWRNFEQTGKTLDQVKAKLGYLNERLESVIPRELLIDIQEINEKGILDEFISNDTGTLLKISGLRDRWTTKEINNITNSMGFLIPPSEQRDYVICIKKSPEDDCLIIENDISDEYDYKITAEFDGEKFIVELDRNEFDLNKIPSEVFELGHFKEYPYRYEDFKRKKIKFDFTVPELMNTEQDEHINLVKEIGQFKFNYIFMKLALTEDSKETFFYKEISKKRKLWLNSHGGIKIYRDHFLVRPYGDPNTDAYDWLGLDARRANNPAAISHPSGNWHVRNRQGQGTLLISRMTNSCILDKSSREGIIENEHFSVFKIVIKNILAVFEKDRAHIGKGMKDYYDIINKRETTKQEGKEIANKFLDEKIEKDGESASPPNQEEVKKLAKTVQYLEEEREELISEIKLLRSLATNGLITTSIVHDLKGINARLVNRVDSLQYVIKNDIENMISRHLNDLGKDDTFLKSWITVITNQIKKDKRKRLKKDLYQTIQDIIDVMEPILAQKQINVEFNLDEKQVHKRIFVADFESIIYNLIINSIEAFERTKLSVRKIVISLETDEDFTIHYNDNGCGLGEKFKNPYDIFKFGATSKYDKDGEQIGTGLGMYIVASTAREYNAQYIITEINNGFGLDIKFPL